MNNAKRPKNQKFLDMTALRELKEAALSAMELDQKMERLYKTVNVLKNIENDSEEKIHC